MRGSRFIKERGPILAAAIFLFLAWTSAAGTSYDPLAVPEAFRPEYLDLTVHDAGRNRDVPVRVYLPSDKKPVPVILFSHGLGGSREGNAFMGKHWSARGYVVVFFQHPGSDTSVWKDVPSAKRMEAMREAANAKNLLLRIGDVRAVLDRLEEWNRDKKSPLAGRLDMGRVGMSGHSFGAVTTQAVSGQQFGAFNRSAADPRIKAAVIFSPSSPRRGDPKRAFEQVKIPWMLMTGTRDIAPIGEADLDSRLAVFPALPPGGKYELVLHEAEHFAFTDVALPGREGRRNPNHHRVILALSTAFWDAYLKEDKQARDWLDGDGPLSLLEPRDHWQKK